MKLFDVCIVGGGISGLYMAYRLEQCVPNIRILVIEKEEKVGGRVRMERFHGRLVVRGAGVGRWVKDSWLRQLCEKACPSQQNASWSKPFQSKICYQFSQPVSTLLYIKQLREKLTTSHWISQHRSTKNFKDCFLHYFSSQEYKQFCLSNGFTDFENADMIDTLLDYGFEDNIPGSQFFSVPWNSLLTFLKTSLRKTQL